MDQHQQSTRQDLFEGIDRLIETRLALDRHRTRTAALTVGRRKPLALDGVGLVRALYDQLARNWDRALACKPAGSEENFRWHAPQRNLALHNRSPEVTLERRLMAACDALGRTDWSNQVPLISGISGPYAHKRRAVDLVHARPSGGFEFVELKVGSDTPLYAALEILQYGLLWLLSRRERHQLGYGGRPIVEATSLHLSVLAPQDFFVPFELREFAAALDEGVSALGRESGVEMRFSQTAFPPHFAWSHPCPYTNSELMDFLDNREPV